MKKEIQKVRTWGRSLAEKMERVDSLQELDTLEREIAEFADYATDKFGYYNDDLEEYDCDLAIAIYVALDWKRKTLYVENLGNSATESMFKRFLREFLDELEADAWVEMKGERV